MINRQTDNTGEMITVLDEQGECVLISRDEYRVNVLAESFRVADDDAESLNLAVLNALRDGFVAESVAPAQRLYEIDDERERATVTLGTVLAQSGKLAEARLLFEEFLEDKPDSSRVMSHLARVLGEMGERDAACDLLWKSLTLDPNQDEGLDWWGEIHFERDGAQSFYRAMERAAQLPASWRPQIWLARRHLEQHEIKESLTLYHQVIEKAEGDARSLQIVSGDLVNNGYAAEVKALILPLYDAAQHGAETGLNLIQACYELGDRATGLALCNAIERFARPDQAHYIKHFRQELKQM
ncbi:MAG: hypothetical protein MSG64_19345 [Pyrinomonadaceae bacterium MAG19_C2-C3]|nr:hypothetical protein [Pyrinomonadaceae bacterium MAG19_C2-C3]